MRDEYIKQNLASRASREYFKLSLHWFVSTLPGNGKKSPIVISLVRPAACDWCLQWDGCKERQKKPKSARLLLWSSRDLVPGLIQLSLLTDLDFLIGISKHVMNRGAVSTEEGSWPAQTNQHPSPSPDSLHATRRGSTRPHGPTADALNHTLCESDIHVSNCRTVWGRGCSLILARALRSLVLTSETPGPSRCNTNTRGYDDQNYSHCCSTCASWRLFWLDTLGVRSTAGEFFKFLGLFVRWCVQLKCHLRSLSAEVSLPPDWGSRFLRKISNKGPQVN